MIHVTIDTPDRNVAKTQMRESIDIPVTLGLGDRLFAVTDITNQSVQHAKHLKKMLSGGHSILFDLRFFATVFLFDDCVCRPLFLVGRLFCAGGPCCGQFVAATAALVVECPGIYQFANAGPYRFGDLVALFSTSAVLLATRMVHGMCLLVGRHKHDARPDRISL
jgi:hypothetical protein